MVYCLSTCTLIDIVHYRYNFIGIMHRPDWTVVYRERKCGKTRFVQPLLNRLSEPYRLKVGRIFKDNGIRIDLGGRERKLCVREEKHHPPFFAKIAMELGLMCLVPPLLLSSYAPDVLMIMFWYVLHYHKIIPWKFLTC